MTSLKIYYKCHNLDNIDEPADWDRSHMASFYAHDCGIYTSALTYDPNSTNTSNPNGSVWTFIDPSACLSASPTKSSIGLLSTFNCSYAMLDFIGAASDAGLVTKVGCPPDTSLTMLAHGFIPEQTSVFPLPNGGKLGTHFVHFQLNSGQDFVYAHYEQLGVGGNANRVNMLQAIEDLVAAITLMGSPPFIFIVNTALSFSQAISNIKANFPLYGTYPQNVTTTFCTLGGPNNETIQNRHVIITNGIDCDIKTIPPQTPVPYSFDEQNAIIVDLKNLKIGSGTSANASAVGNFNLDPKTIILNQV